MLAVVAANFAAAVDAAAAAAAAASVYVVVSASAAAAVSWRSIWACAFWLRTPIVPLLYLHHLC